MSAPRKTARPRVLSGGNPQVPKGEGDGPVQAYLDAMPGWKRDVGKRLDALIVAAAPNVKKAVKWNTPLYGMEDGLWFTSFHCFDRYVKVTFFRGEDLKPPPPVGSKVKGVRYLHVHEYGALDEAQFSAWIEQASVLPGEKL